MITMTVNIHQDVYLLLVDIAVATGRDIEVVAAEILENHIQK